MSAVWRRWCWSRQALIARLTLSYIAWRGLPKLQMPAASREVLATYPCEVHAPDGRRIMGLRDAIRLVRARRAAARSVSV